MKFSIFPAGVESCAGFCGEEPEAGLEFSPDDVAEVKPGFSFCADWLLRFHQPISPAACFQIGAVSRPFLLGSLGWMD